MTFMTKKIIIPALLLMAAACAHAQLRIGGNEQMAKLRMAEMAITNLYVDSVDEPKLVETPYAACWRSSTRTPPIQPPRR